MNAANANDHDAKDYGFKNNLNLKEDPFKHLMTKSQQVELQQRINNDFTLKNADCDKYDYMIAGTCGVIGGLIDILFVGMPGDSKLGNVADEQANKITEKFAEFVGWDKDKAVEKLKNFLLSNGIHEISSKKTGKTYKVKDMRAA